MAFPPPTHGYEEKPIGDSVMEYLLPRPTVTTTKAPNSLSVAGIDEGDVLTVEPHRTPANGSIALIEKDGELFVVKLRWHQGKWFAQTDSNQGVVTEDINYVALVRTVIKSQL
ncbi:hypothetical protein [Photobacterium nomapromontoriensis]|uniref:hypothetical protein n=1 Tax=Photobacterium nomapromontoriensis TaxID=2910237 RepID=UPI003D0C4EB1